LIVVSKKNIIIMQSHTAYRSRTGLVTALLFIIAFTFLIVWLPLVRSILDGDTYEWGLNYFGTFISGAGITFSLLFLVIQLFFYVAIFWSVFRAKNRIIAYGLVVLWWIHIFGNLLREIVVEGDTMFHGDTLNVHVSLSMLVIPLSAITALIIALWIRKDIRSTDTSIPWSRRNTTMALIILGPLPIQAILLYFGEPHATTDEIGVLITILQCMMVPLIFFPYGKSSH